MISPGAPGGLYLSQTGCDVIISLSLFTFPLVYIYFTLFWATLDGDLSYLGPQRLETFVRMFIGTDYSVYIDSVILYNVILYNVIL